MTTKVDAVEAARAELAQAKVAHAREEQRHAEAVGEVARLTAELAEADPDRAADFSKLVSARTAAAARVEALESRARKARAHVTGAEDRLADLEAEQRQARLARLDAAIAAQDQAVTALLVDVRDRVAVEIAKLDELLGAANALEPHISATARRGARWAFVPRGGVLRFAASFLDF
jgi:chromosome segregation ATPase